MLLDCWIAAEVSARHSVFRHSHGRKSIRPVDRNNSSNDDDSSNNKASERPTAFLCYKYHSGFQLARHNRNFKGYAHRLDHTLLSQVVSWLHWIRDQS
eukprot:5327062-Amphidinium_carterae.1